MSELFTCPTCWANITASAQSGSCPECGELVVADIAYTYALMGSKQPLPLTTGYSTPAEVDNETDLCDCSAEGAGPTVPEIPNHHSLRYHGAGGMSQVYYGEQDHTNRPVAIKLIHPTYAGEASQRRRFVAEMKAMGRVLHPNVIPIIAVGENDGRLYYTMEYMVHGSLHQQITRNKPANDFKAVARWLMQAGHGIAAGHALNILHRDIKPSNILLDDDGVAMIADYGLAKFLDETEGLTQTQAILGTSNYMPPEQALGRISQLNFRSDVYSLGATLYHMLTGQTPFKATSTVETLRMVVEETLPNPRSIHPTIPEALERICLKAIEKNPSDRYDCADAFANDLARYLEDQRPVGRPVTRIQKASRFLKRNRVRIAMVATSLLVSMAVALRPVPDESRKAAAQIEAALKRGEEVVLVGETSLPAYHRWQRGDALLGLVEDNETPAQFQTATTSRLILVEDPMCEHYRIHAELKQTGGIQAAGDIGLFFGFNQMIDDQLIRHVFVIDWCEYYGNTKNIPIGNGRMLSDDHHLAARLRYDSYPNNKTGSYACGLGAFRFIPYDFHDGEWRAIEVEASPAGFKVRFQVDPSPAELVDAFFVPSKAIKKDIGLQIENYCAQMQIPVPENRTDWSPRGPFGIFAQNAIVSFRNVILTPLSPLETE